MWLRPVDADTIDGEGSSWQTGYTPARGPSRPVKRARRSYVCILVRARVAAGVAGDGCHSVGRGQSPSEERPCTSPVILSLPAGRQAQRRIWFVETLRLAQGDRTEGFGNRPSGMLAATGQPDRAA